MTNKIIFAAIALGLWANVITNLTRPAKADTDEALASIAEDLHAFATGDAPHSALSSIADDFHALVLGRTLMGGAGCRNKRICDEN